VPKAKPLRKGENPSSSSIFLIEGIGQPSYDSFLVSDRIFYEILIDTREPFQYNMVITIKQFAHSEKVEGR
jgi:hypothetical protein